METKVVKTDMCNALLYMFNPLFTASVNNFLYDDGSKISK